MLDRSVKQLANFYHTFPEKTPDALKRHLNQLHPQRTPQQYNKKSQYDYGNGYYNDYNRYNNFYPNRKSVIYEYIKANVKSFFKAQVNTSYTIGNVVTNASEALLYTIEDASNYSPTVVPENVHWEDYTPN